MNILNIKKDLVVTGDIGEEIVYSSSKFDLGVKYTTISHSDEIGVLEIFVISKDFTSTKRIKEFKINRIGYTSAYDIENTDGQTKALNKLKEEKDSISLNISNLQDLADSLDPATQQDKIDKINIKIAEDQSEITSIDSLISSIQSNFIFDTVKIPTYFEMTNFYFDGSNIITSEGINLLETLWKPLDNIF